MFFRLNSAAVAGLSALSVTVEVDITKGQTNFSIVGMADTAIKEAKDRVHSAIKNSGYNYPFNFRILINLAPADLPKEGTAYDLPIAVGMIAASGERVFDLSDAVMVGELALDGQVRHVNGVLLFAMFAVEQRYRRIFVPAMDAAEAALISGVEIFPVQNLAQLVEHLTRGNIIPAYERESSAMITERFYDSDMADVKGQEFAKRGLEVAAAGGHNVIFSGPPGSGKTMLARALPSILPELSREEALEVTKIYSVAGLLDRRLIEERPFRSPHHSASAVALVGGGRVPRPGEITLSHRGVLFLDEFPEFPRFAIESLRQPLEDGVISVARAAGSLTFPARFILVASQNPCPCGFDGDSARVCSCTPLQIARYRQKVSGPVLDRIDLQIEVPRLDFEKLSEENTGESSSVIRERVRSARGRQASRFHGLGIHTNSEMRSAELRKFCALGADSLDLLRAATAQMRLSARAFNRVLKVSRTIADLSGSDKILLEHVAEALQYRGNHD